MNLVFKKFNVCDDIADKIAKSVHKGYQKEINNHISVMVNWDPYYNYFNIYNNTITIDFMLKLFEENIDEIDMLISDLLNRIDRFNYAIKISGTDYIKNKYKISRKKLSTEQYLKYIFSSKKIFSLISITRNIHMLNYIHNILTNYNFTKWWFKLHNHPYQFLNNPQSQQNNLYLFKGNIFNRLLSSFARDNINSYEKKFIEIEKKNFEINNKSKDPLMYYIHYPKKNIEKKHLREYLYQNKKTKYSLSTNKRKLWNMIYDK